MKEQSFKTRVMVILGTMADKVGRKSDGTLNVKRSYFYRHGMDSQKWADKVMAASLGSTKISDFCDVVEHRDEFRQWPHESYFVVVLREKKGATK